MATGSKEATTQPTTTQYRKTPKRTFSIGYGCEFVEPPPEILTTECSICLHILHEPHQVSCCGQHFCKSCIERTWSENKPCPLCNQLDFTATLDKSMQRHLNALRVYCTNKDQGCEWVGELRDLDHHLNANPKSGEELTGCEFVELSCIHGCGGRFQHCSLTEHHNNCPLRPFSCEHCSYSSTYQDVVDNHMAECPKYPLQCPNNCEESLIERKNFDDHQNTCQSRPFRCEYCGHSSTYQDVVTNHWAECPQYPLQCPNSCGKSPIDRKYFEDHKTTCPRRPFSCDYCSYTSTYKDVVTNHWVECPKFPLPCPNNCKESPIERQHLEDHSNKDCPLEMVNCEFQFAGCTAQVQRRDLEAHMKDKLSQHITSTTNKLVTGMRDEINQTVEQQVTTLRDEMKQRQLETESMVKQEQAEVKARQDNLERQLKQQATDIKQHENHLGSQLKSHEDNLERQLKQQTTDIKQHEQTVKTASDNTQRQIQRDVATLKCYGMTVVAIIVAFVAVLVAVIIMQHQQIQQLRHDQVEAIEQIQQLRQDHVEATDQIQQLRQDHVGATDQIQQLRQDHTGATEQIQQLRQDHTGATEQIQQLQHDHVEATDQIQQLRQDHSKATEQIQQLQQDHIGAIEKLSGDFQNLQYQLLSLLVFPMCTAEGPGLYSPTVNKANEITVSLVNFIDSEYTGTGVRVSVSVTSELESEEDGSIIQASVSQVEASKYRVTYTPRVRGRSKLYVKVNNIDIKGSPFSLFVSLENPQELKGLSQPWGIAINSRGEIYVTEWLYDKVFVFDTNRQKLRTFGSRGHNVDGKFWYPAGIDIDMNDNVYVASNHKVQKFNRNGEHIKSVGSSREVRGVRVHNDKVYVSDMGNHCILVHDQKLMFIRQFGIYGTGQAEFDRPHDIAFDAYGNAYVVDSGNNRVQVLKEDGEFLREFGSEELESPCGIHINGDYVYVSDKSKVVAFRTSGDFVTTIRDNLSRVCGITTDSKGGFYICEFSEDHCKKL